MIKMTLELGKDKKIELTLTEAKKLYEELKTMFDKSNPLDNWRPFYPPVIDHPKPWYPGPTVTYCKTSDNSTDSLEKQFDMNVSS